MLFCIYVCAHTYIDRIYTIFKKRPNECACNGRFKGYFCEWPVCLMQCPPPPHALHKQEGGAVGPFEPEICIPSIVWHWLSHTDSFSLSQPFALSPSRACPFNVRLCCTPQRNLNLCIPRRGIARPQPQFPHSCVFERSINSHVRSTYFPAAE